MNAPEQGALHADAGEAPEEGAVFRQRSRWCKGHLQVSCLGLLDFYLGNSS